jgi:hypothetical protein
MIDITLTLIMASKAKNSDVKVLKGQEGEAQGQMTTLSCLSHFASAEDAILQYLKRVTQKKAHICALLT